MAILVGNMPYKKDATKEVKLRDNANTWITWGEALDKKAKKNVKVSETNAHILAVL